MCQCDNITEQRVVTLACISADAHISGCNQNTSGAAVNSECGLVWLLTVDSAASLKFKTKLFTTALN